MFGYVRIDEDELLVRQQRKYKQAYCALCRQIGCCSRPARMLLSYDMVFCVLLSEAEVPEEKRQCRGKLFRHCRKRCGDRKLQYISAVSIILQYYKLRDDVYDGKKGRKLLMNSIGRGFRQAKESYPEIEERVASAMRTLSELEAEGSRDWDRLDGCFSGILYDVFRLSPQQDEFTEIRARLSQHVAAWVYWFDMLKDLEEDRKERNYNTILLFEDEVWAREHVTELLLQHLSEAETLCELLPWSDNLAIIYNIVTCGLPEQMAEISPAIREKGKEAENALS